MKSYDVAIIGSGPGGYVAGFYASRRKLKACVIEKDLVGGTCLNRGCIPTKSLLATASVISTIKDAPRYGVEVGSPVMNFPKALQRKDEVVTRLRAGIETLFRANKIELVPGAAHLIDHETIEVSGAGRLSAKNIIIATGSRAFELPNIKYDHVDILSSDDILNIRSIPKSLVVIGGGVIGCEFATIFNAFGAKVTVVELMDRLIPAQSREVSKKLELVLKKSGVEVITSASVEGVRKGGAMKVALAGGREIEGEKVLVSVGRRANTEGLGLETIGIKTEKGAIVVDRHLRTGARNIFAIGDCARPPMLAHKASYEGVLACDNILGEAREADYTLVPNCIWTEPEIASIGLTEDEAKLKCHDIRIAKFPYLASAKACLEGRPEGFVKIIGDSRGEIIGVEIFGDEACELIGEAVLAKTAGVKIKDWARVVHGHPTLSEIFQEAAHIFCGSGIHTI